MVKVLFRIFAVSTPPPPLSRGLALGGACSRPHVQYQAKAQNKEIFLAEVQRDIAQSLYANLKDFKVEMPKNVIQSGGAGGESAGKMPSNLDVITGFSALGLMEKAMGATGSTVT